MSWLTVITQIRWCYLLFTVVGRPQSAAKLDAIARQDLDLYLSVWHSLLPSSHLLLYSQEFSSFLADSYFLLLTYLSHSVSFSLHCSSFLSSLSRIFLFFLIHTGISLFLTSPTSVSPCISLLFLLIYCDSAFNLTVLCVSAWYAAVYSHTMKFIGASWIWAACIRSVWGCIFQTNAMAGQNDIFITWNLFVQQKERNFF